ncbi:hypothetical protein [Pseudomonas sp. PGPPP4]|uniref:hypothetical protein n=1 Tax=Pseudomonas sp. PGPPP4 TaxID=2015556 RepID=UPI00257FA88D|nr:hypothetical protein [Pseudomonas sp. PGPPP4]
MAIDKEELIFYIVNIKKSDIFPQQVLDRLDSSEKIAQDHLDLLDEAEQIEVLERYRRVFERIETVRGRNHFSQNLLDELKVELEHIYLQYINPTKKAVDTIEKLFKRRYINTNDKINSIFRQAEKTFYTIEKLGSLSKTNYEDSIALKKEIEHRESIQRETLQTLNDQIELRTRESQLNIEEFLKDRRESFLRLSEKLKQDFELKLSEASDAQVNEIKNIISPKVTAAEKQIEAISAIKLNAEKILGLISQGATESHYQKAYISERNTRVLWQILATLGFVGLIFAAYYITSTIQSIIESGLNTQTLIALTAKASAAFFTLFFIRFCSQNARRHHELEKFNRQLRLELLTIDGYLSSIKSESERDSAKIILKEKFFGLTESILERDHVKKTEATDLVKAIESLVKALPKELLEKIKTSN